MALLWGSILRDGVAALDKKIHRPAQAKRRPVYGAALPIREAPPRTLNRPECA